MTFDQSIGLTIASLIIGASGFLAWYDKAAFAVVGRGIVGLAIGVGALMFCYSLGYTHGASDQWFSAFNEVNTAARVKAGVQPVEFAYLKGGPIQSWMWECWVLVLFAEFVLLVVHPLLRGHTELEAKQDAAQEPKDRK